MLKTQKPKALARVVLLAALGVPALSFAAGPDFTALTAAVDFTTVGAAILAIAALQVVPGVIKWGARRVLSMIGR